MKLFMVSAYYLDGLLCDALPTLFDLDGNIRHEATNVDVSAQSQYGCPMRFKERRITMQCNS